MLGRSRICPRRSRSRSRRAADPFSIRLSAAERKCPHAKTTRRHSKVGHVRLRSRASWCALVNSRACDRQTRATSAGPASPAPLPRSAEGCRFAPTGAVPAAEVVPQDSVAAGAGAGEKVQRQGRSPDRQPAHHGAPHQRHLQLPPALADALGGALIWASCRSHLMSERGFGVTSHAWRGAAW